MLIAAGPRGHRLGVQVGPYSVILHTDSGVMERFTELGRTSRGYGLPARRDWRCRLPLATRSDHRDQFRRHALASTKDSLESHRGLGGQFQWHLSLAFLGSRGHHPYR